MLNATYANLHNISGVMSRIMVFTQGYVYTCSVNRYFMCLYKLVVQYATLLREGLNKNINKISGIFHGGLTPPTPSVENY